jgi:hypothetical protein
MMNVGMRSPEPTGFGASAPKTAAAKDLSNQDDRGPRGKDCSFGEQLDESLSATSKSDEDEDASVDIPIVVAGQPLPAIQIDPEPIAVVDGAEQVPSAEVDFISPVDGDAVAAPDAAAVDVEPVAVAAANVSPLALAEVAGEPEDDTVDATADPKAPESPRRSVQPREGKPSGDVEQVLPVAAEKGESASVDTLRPPVADAQTGVAAVAEHGRPNLADHNQEDKQDPRFAAPAPVVPATPIAGETAKSPADVRVDGPAETTSRTTEAAPRVTPLGTAAPQPLPAAAHFDIPPAAPTDVPRGPLPAETSESIIQSLRMQYQRGGGDAIVHIKPEHLGPVTVSMRVENGAVTAVIDADNPAVAEWLRANEHVLRDGLASSGLHLERFTVKRDGQSPDESRKHWRPPDPPQRRRSLQPQSTFEITV